MGPWRACVGAVARCSVRGHPRWQGCFLRPAAGGSRRWKSPPCAGPRAECAADAQRSPPAQLPHAAAGVPALPPAPRQQAGSGQPPFLGWARVPGGTGLASQRFGVGSGCTGEADLWHTASVGLSDRSFRSPSGSIREWCALRPWQIAGAKSARPSPRLRCGPYVHFQCPHTQNSAWGCGLLVTVKCFCTRSHISCLASM